MYKKIISVLVFLLISNNIAFAKSFNDVQKNHWAYNVITQLSDEGVISGYTDGTFKPSNNITRAEFSSLLVLASKLKSSNVRKFEDVLDSHWAYDYISIVGIYWPKYNQNSDTKFFPEDKCTREEVAATIVLANGLENNSYSMGNLDNFSDSNLISEDLRKYVAIAYETGLMVGNADGTFNPKGKLTRAEVAQIIFNIKKIEKDNSYSYESDKNYSNDSNKETVLAKEINETIVKIVCEKGQVYITDINGNKCEDIFYKKSSVNSLENGTIEIGYLANGESINGIFIEKILSESYNEYEIKLLSLEPLSFIVSDSEGEKCSLEEIDKVSFLVKIIF